MRLGNCSWPKKPVASGNRLLCQNPDFNGPYASQNETSGFGVNFTSYDNIALSSRTTLTSVEWIGGYHSPRRAGSTLGLDNIGGPIVLYGAAVNFSVAQERRTGYRSHVVLPSRPSGRGQSPAQDNEVSYTHDPFGNRMQDSTDFSFVLFRQQPSTTPELHSQMLLGCGEASFTVKTI